MGKSIGVSDLVSVTVKVRNLSKHKMASHGRTTGWPKRERSDSFPSPQNLGKESNRMINL